MSIPTHRSDLRFRLDLTTLLKLLNLLLVGLQFHLQPVTISSNSFELLGQILGIVFDPKHKEKKFRKNFFHQIGQRRRFFPSLHSLLLQSLEHISLLLLKSSDQVFSLRGAMSDTSHFQGVFVVGLLETSRQWLLLILQYGGPFVGLSLGFCGFSELGFLLIQNNPIRKMC